MATRATRKVRPSPSEISRHQARGMRHWLKLAQNRGFFAGSFARAFVGATWKAGRAGPTAILINQRGRVAVAWGSPR